MTYQATQNVLADVVREQALRRGNDVAIVFDERPTTYAELDAASNRVACGLRAHGLEKGERVALLAKDSDRLFEVLFGCAKAGLPVVCVNWRLAAAELAHILSDSGARAVFAGEEVFDKLDALEIDAAVTCRVALTGARQGWQSFAEWRDAQATSDPRVPIEANDPVVHLYTSGTTGKPKGVQLANRSFFAVVNAMNGQGDSWFDLGPQDVNLLVLPAFHVGGLWWAITSLNAGARCILMDAFVPWQALELTERHRVTILGMVPAMIQMVLSEPTCASTDFSSVTRLVYGASPMPKALLEKSIAMFGCGCVQFYGLTETGNTAVCLRPEDHLDLDSARINSAGRPYPGVEVRCIDLDGNEVATGDMGEICIRSPATMLGYWNQPQATDEVLVDGWLHTGDAGYIDAHGYVFVRDRIKDMIIYAGDNVYPAEVESAITSHDGVAEVAVIGVPDERWGETVKAFVVRRPSATVTPREIVDHARAQVAEFKLPRSVEFVETLPRTPSGKVRKSVLREPYWEGMEKRVN